MNDLISRQAALQAMDTWDKFGCGPDGKLVRYDDDNHYVPYVHYDDMVHAIRHLPSAESRKGKWAGTGDSEGFGIFICGACGKFAMLKSNFCPNCGADMREEGQDE